MKNAISFDESGNTGQDLLNKDQRAFVLSSVCFDNSEIDILSTLFKTPNEIHFKNLKNSKNGREKIIEFVNHDLITEGNIISSVSNKEYVVVAQVVDQLIETVFYKFGIDIYQYGTNLTYTNSIYYFGNHFWNKELYFKFLNLFVAMIRKKDDESINKFYKSAYDLYNSGTEDYYQVLEPILESQRYISSIMDAVTKYTLDVTLSSFMVLCDRWYKKIKTKVNVYFDNSKQIEHYQDYITFCRNLCTNETEVGFGSRTMTFPAQIEKLELVDSTSNLQVQIADLVASTIAFVYNNQNDKQIPFVEQIQESKLFNLKNFHTIWPEPKITPEDLDMTDGNGVNVLDFLAQKKMEQENNNA
jgi:hypothetical protein